MPALRMLDVLAPANLPHQVQAAAHVAAIEIAAVAVVAGGRNRAAEQLREQDFGQRLHHRLGRARQRIGQAHVERVPSSSCTCALALA